VTAELDPAPTAVSPPAAATTSANCWSLRIEFSALH
jgi:hypothetical protein